MNDVQHFSPATSVFLPPSLGKEDLFDLIGNACGVTADSVEHLESNFDIFIHKHGCLYYRMKYKGNIIKPIYNQHEVFITREDTTTKKVDDIGVIHTHDDEGQQHEDMLETGEFIPYVKYLHECHGIKPQGPSTFVIYFNEPDSRYSSTTKDHHHSGKAVTWFDAQILELDSEKYKQDGMVHQVWNDGSITCTKGGPLFGYRGLKCLPQWQQWGTPEECAHIKLPHYDEDVPKHTFAFVSEIGAYKVRNLIRLRLDEEAKLRASQNAAKNETDNKKRKLDEDENAIKQE